MKRTTITTTHSRRRLAGLAAGVALLLTAACGGSSDLAADGSARTIVDQPAGVALATGVDSSGPATTATFVADATALLNDVTEAGVLVGEVLDRADVTSPEWQAEAIAVLQRLGTLLMSAADLEAPAEFEQARQQLIDSTAQYEAATRLLADGIETLDLDKIGGAAEGLANAIVAIANMRALLNTL